MTTEECSLEDVADQVVSVNEVGICRGVLCNISHPLWISEHG